VSEEEDAYDKRPLDPQEWRKWRKERDRILMGYVNEDNVLVPGIIQTLFDLRRIVLWLAPFVIISACSQTLTAIHGTPLFDLIVHLMEKL
jgi:hypothetical protein